MSKFPIKPISDFFTVTSSKRVYKADWTKSGVPFYRAREIVKLAENGAVDNDLYISEEQFQELSEKKGTPMPGDIMVSAVGTIGHCYVVKKSDRFYFKDASVIWFKKEDDIDSRYVKYAFQSEFARDQIMANSMGATVRTFTIGRAKKIKIPIPPLDEQKRIVAILDEAFEAIGQAKASIEQNIENTEKLFQSRLNNILDHSNEGWEEKPLKDITSKIGSGATPKGGKKSYKESGISLIRSLNVYDDGFREKDLAFIDEKQASKLDRVKVEKGDVLLNITGASVARCCIAPDDYLPARVNQHVSIIRLKENTIQPKYLHYCLISETNKSKLLRISDQGATRQALTKSQIKNFKVRYPKSFDEQDEIIQLLDEFRKYTTEFKSIYKTKLQNLKRLKRSILQQAFSGKLTKKELVA